VNLPREVFGVERCHCLPKADRTIKTLAFAPKPVTFRQIFPGVVMRAFSAFSLVLAFLLQPALAQGVKDPPNYPQTSVQSWKKTQAGQDPSRTTATTGRLPASLAAQRLSRDGKLVTTPR
jgi:hypothetical protein